MSKGFKHGAGSASSLNFEVKAYPSEVELNTATAKENTIGVVTTNPITGWHFTTEQPENMADGELWFATDKSSTVAFNALKKNNVTVYPNSVKQMVSGALKDVTVKTYKDGEWVDWWNGELFDNGKQFEHVTGGWWQNPDLLWGQYSNTTAPVIGDTIKVEAPSGSNASIATTKNAINMERFEKLHVTVVPNADGSSISFAIRLHTANSGSVQTTTVAELINVTTAGDYTISLEGVTQDVYVSIGAPSGRSSTVSKIWLEK